MTINGVSQTTGLEQLVDVSHAEDGLRLRIRDRKPGSDWVDLIIPADPFMTVLSEQPTGSHRIAGNDGKVLEVEVRRNEVMLSLGGPDAAVGLDDLMDAVAGALSSA